MTSVPSQPSAHSIPLLPFIALLLGGTAIGFAAIFMRISEVNPIASAFWRMALSAPVLWIWALQKKTRQTVSSTFNRFMPLVVWAGFYFAGDMGLWHAALHSTSVAKATLLSNLAPVFIALFMWKIQGTRFQQSFVIGLLIALAGAAILVWGKAPASSGSSEALGDALGLCSALFYAGYQLAIKKARNHFSTPRLMAWSTTFTALFLLPAALLWEGPFFPSHLAGWLPLLGLAFIAQIGGQTVIAYSSAHLPAALSSIGLLVQPLTATIAAWVLFHEIISPLQLFGGLMIIGGIYLSRRSSIKQVSSTSKSS